jgi:hypothetical protein
MPVRPPAARRLRQHGQQRGFGARQTRGRLAEVGAARGFDALDGAAERRAFEVEGQDLALGQMRFELQRAQDLLEFGPWRARMSGGGPVEDARDLHGQRRPTRHDVPAQQPLPARAQQRHGIDAGVAPEPAVLVVQQHLQVQRRDLLRRDRVAPDALRIGERTQRRAVARDHQGAGVALLRQWQRECEVEEQQRQQEGDGAPAEPRQETTPSAATPSRRIVIPAWTEIGWLGV